MNKNLLVAAMAALSCAFMLSCGKDAHEDISVIPTPVHMEKTSGHYDIADGTSIGISDKSLKAAATYLAESFSGKAALAVTEDIDKAGISLILKPGYESGEYSLKVSPSGIVIEATDLQGIISGIATLRQLMPESGCAIQAMQVRDKPRYAWRGLMIDASRHFWDKEEIEKVLDLMALYKLNKFHWHLTDDQGWRIEIDKYPLLTEKGAWRQFDKNDKACISRARQEDNPELQLPEKRLRIENGDTLYGGFYTKADIREIVRYASDRGIDIIPEVDMPGHCLAAIQQYPELGCKGLVGWGKNFSSPLCVGNDQVLEFCKNVYREVFELFPYEYVHIGGDEVEKDNWEKCSLCQARIRKEGLGSVEGLQAWFIRQMEGFFKENGKKLIGWDEVTKDGLGNESVIMWWRIWVPDAVPTATAEGKNVIICPTEYMYFSREQTVHSMSTILGFDPSGFPNLSERQLSLIKGVQANVWAEGIPSFRRLCYILFPRLFALSEISWCEREAVSTEPEFEKMLPPHFRRLDALGINYRIPDLNGVYDINAFTDTVTVRPGCPFPGVQIRYTTDGSFPNINSPLATDGIFVDKDMTLKLRAFRADGSADAVRTCSFFREEMSSAIDPLREGSSDETLYKKSDSKPTLKPGIKVKWYGTKVIKCADIDAPGNILKGEYTVDRIAIPSEANGIIGLVFNGYIKLPSDGVYTFALLSDDGSELKLDGEKLGDNDGEHSTEEITVQKAMMAGFHPIQVRYFDSNGGSLELALIENGVRKQIPAEWLWHLE